MNRGRRWRVKVWRLMEDHVDVNAPDEIHALGEALRMPKVHKAISAVELQSKPDEDFDNLRPQYVRE